MRGLAVARAGARAVLPDAVYRRIRARRVRGLISGYTPRTVRHTYGGYPLTIRLADPLAEGWYDHDVGEPPEISALRRGRLRPGARVFDLGAHQGVLALIVSRIVESDGQVVAVEAESHNAAVARENVALNDAANLTIIHAAGGAREGELSFTESLNGMVARRGAPGSVTVPAVTVDGLADRFGPPDVVMIDVEGHEGHVLAGAERTLAGGKTDFFVELHEEAWLAAAGSTAQQVVERFDRSRYQLSVGIPEGRGTDAVQRWVDVDAGAHLAGERCFLVARACD